MNYDVDHVLQFLHFVQERHRIWERRQAGLLVQDGINFWTKDPVLASKKFTNVFRVLDPGSQFVFRLASPSAGLRPLAGRDLLMRLFLYRYTNLPATWLHLLDVGLGFPLVEDLDSVRGVWQEYRGKLLKRIERGNRTQHEHRLFSGAYVIMPDPGSPGDKLDKVIALTKRLFDPCSPDDIWYDWHAAESQLERLDILRAHRGVGDFMAMQILTDWGYVGDTEDRENEFVVCGPGSRKGARYLAPKLPADSVVEWAQAAIHDADWCPTIEGRRPSLMDVQNCLCEYSKYVRYLGRAAASGGSERPIQTYRPAHPGPQPRPVLPQHWRRNR